MTRTITTLASGLVGFAASTTLSLIAGRDRDTALKFGVVGGGSTAVATWIATGEKPPSPREEPIRIEIED